MMLHQHRRRLPFGGANRACEKYNYCCVMVLVRPDIGLESDWVMDTTATAAATTTVPRLPFSVGGGITHVLLPSVGTCLRAPLALVVASRMYARCRYRVWDM